MALPSAIAVSRHILATIVLLCWIYRESCPHRTLNLAHTARSRYLCDRSHLPSLVSLSSLHIRCLCERLFSESTVGTSRFLKENVPGIKCFAADPPGASMFAYYTKVRSMKQDRSQLVTYLGVSRTMLLFLFFSLDAYFCVFVRASLLFTLWCSAFTRRSILFLGWRGCPGAIPSRMPSPPSPPAVDIPVFSTRKAQTIGFSGRPTTCISHLSLVLT